MESLELFEQIEDTKRQKSGRSNRQKLAEMAAEQRGILPTNPVVQGAIAGGSIAHDLHSIKHRLKQSEATAQSIQCGDMRALEELLISHIGVLDTAFCELLLKGMAIIEAATNAKARQQGVSLVELALKAQKQSRQNVMSLNEMRNPKRATFIKNQLNQLIQEKSNDQRLDRGAPPKAITEDTRVEALGKINRSTDSGRKKNRVKKCET